MMDTVLITGASGFIGGRLAEQLAGRHARVRCLVRESSSTEMLEALDVELIRGSLFDSQQLRAAVQGVDCVYHVAGLRFAVTPKELTRVNMETTGSLARICAEQPSPPVVVYVSSVAAAGPAPRGGVRSDRDPIRPISNYGLSKRLGELAAASLAARAPTTIVRPGIVFGPRNQELFPMFASVARYLHVIPGFVSPRLSMIHIDDLVEILIRAAERGRRVASDGDPTTGYYFACDDEHPTYSQLGQIIMPFVGARNLMRLSIPLPFVYAIAGSFELFNRLRGKGDVFNVDKIREASVASWACSPKRVQTDLGFDPPYRLTDRLNQTARWYLDHGWL